MHDDRTEALEEVRRAIRELFGQADPPLSRRGIDEAIERLLSQFEDR